METKDDSKCQNAAHGHDDGRPHCAAGQNRTAKNDRAEKMRGLVDLSFSSPPPIKRIVAAPVCMQLLKEYTATLPSRP